jgi:hypothetical protein
LKVEWLKAYDIDMSARTEGNRLFTAVTAEDGLPSPGDQVIVSYLEKDWENQGRGKLVHVHDVYKQGDRYIVTFDWLEGQVCH